MLIGNINLPKTAALAPLAGVADRAMREICREYGACWTVGEMTSSKGLSYGSKKSAELLEIGEAERPTAVQLFGSEPETMAQAALMALEYKPEAIDINFGCPVPKVAGNGGGSALMKDPVLAGKIVRAVAEAVPLPKIPENLRYMKAENIASARFGLDFTIIADGENALYPENFDPVMPRERKRISVQAKTPGAFNAYNIMAALTAVSSVTGKNFQEIAQHIPEIKPIKGRMTLIEKGQPFELIVDYAHTPSSFETIFPPLRKRCSGRIFALFGSGGERDVTKRPLQGEIAARFCDFVILADEDPRGEDPVELLKGIAVGAEKAGMKMNENLFIIPDRKKAIRETLKKAQKGDIVLLLGKSHENSIIYKDYTMPYDEICEARQALSELGYK